MQKKFELQEDSQTQSHLYILGLMEIISAITLIISKDYQKKIGAVLVLIMTIMFECLFINNPFTNESGF